MAGQSGIADVELGRLYEALAQVRGPCGQPMDKKQRLQQGQIARYGRVRQSRIPADIGQVEESSGAGGQQLEQVGQGVKRVHLCQIAHITLEQGRNVGGIPCRASRCILALDRLRVAAVTDPSSLDGWKDLRIPMTWNRSAKTPS